MDVFLTILLPLMLYFPAITLISLLAALAAIKNGPQQAKTTFKEVFLDFFMELLNPFNWF